LHARSAVQGVPAFQENEKERGEASRYDAAQAKKKKVRLASGNRTKQLPARADAPS
jgi:hypothetical protein